MRHLLTLAIVAFALTARASQDAGTFVLHDSQGGAKEAHGAKVTKIAPTTSDAAMKFIVIDKEKGPVKGVVIALTSETGGKYFTDETDADGYAETLVPAGSKYELTY